MKRYSRRSDKARPRWGLARVAAATGALVVLMGGVAFAVLQSQQVKLTTNTLETANAGLQISTDGTTFSDAHIGFDFNNIIPGGAFVPDTGYNFYLKNTGGTPLSLKFALSSVPDNPNDIDVSKINIRLTPFATGSSQLFSLQSLIDASLSGGLTINQPASLGVGKTQQFSIQASMAADAITGSSAALGNIDFGFMGVAPTN